MRRSLTLLLTALALGACGGVDSPPSPPAAPPPAGPAKFPRADGAEVSLDQISAGVARGPVLVPTVSVLAPGERARFGFGLFDVERRAINGAPAALYVAPAGGRAARGPFLARAESLSVAPPFRSRSSASDPDAARSFYVARPVFPREGDYDVLALVRLDGRTVVTDVERVRVRRPAGGPPEVGEAAVRVRTPTVDSAGGDLASIDTRLPPSTMHEDDLADVLGERPVVLVFATPLLCRTRVCGPVVDVAEEVKSRLGDEAAFIHMEIYEDNRIDRGFRPQVRAWRLRTEPWAFAIDRHGRVAARLEGAFSVRELERAARAAIAVP